MSEIAVRCVVTGRVQGVGFRYWAQRAARHLGINGWVRNLPDGSVEAVLQGSEDVIAKMLAKLAEGPRYADVASVRPETVAVDHEVGDFAIRF